MSFIIETVFVVKNNQGSYFTGNTHYDSKKWDMNPESAKEFDSTYNLRNEIIEDRKEAEENYGDNKFPPGTYSIEHRIKVIEKE